MRNHVDYLKEGIIYMDNSNDVNGVSYVIAEFIDRFFGCNYLLDSISAIVSEKMDEGAYGRGRGRCTILGL